MLFLRTKYQFFGLKILKFFDADPDPGSVNPGSGIRDGKSQIRDKHPESVTLRLA
jgi:hypothetical protein